MFRLLVNSALNIALTSLITVCTATASLGQTCAEPAAMTASSAQQKTASKRYDRSLPTYRDKSSQYSLALVGDSLIELWQPWIEESFGSRHVMNLGVAGDTTQNTLYRLENLDLPNFYPTDVVILIGTNNLGKDTAPCTVAAGIVAVVNKTQFLWPTAHIYVLSIPPRGKRYASYEDIRTSANHMAASLMFGLPNVTYVQFNDDMLRCGKPSVKECSNYKPDRLHLNEGAYNLIRGALTEAGLQP